MNKVTLRYTEPLLREAVHVFVVRALFRQLGWLFLVAVALVIFIAAVYVAHYRNTIGRFRQMRCPEATMLYDEDGLTFASELGSTTIPWSGIKERWCYPRFWLLLFSPAQFTTLPLGCLDEQCRAFIARKVPQADR